MLKKKKVIGRMCTDLSACDTVKHSKALHLNLAPEQVGRMRMASVDHSLARSVFLGTG